MPFLDSVGLKHLINKANYLPKTGDASNTTTAFTQATTRSNIATGEKQSVIMGKIKKWFADLAAAAFAQMLTSYSDVLANTVSGYLVDALAVKEGFNAINSNLKSYILLKAVYSSPIAIGISGVTEVNFSLNEIDGYEPVLIIYHTNNQNPGIFPYKTSSIVSENAATVGVKNTSGNAFDSVIFSSIAIYVRAS